MVIWASPSLIESTAIYMSEVKMQFIVSSNVMNCHPCGIFPQFATKTLQKNTKMKKRTPPLPPGEGPAVRDPKIQIPVSQALTPLPQVAGVPLRQIVYGLNAPPARPAVGLPDYKSKIRSDLTGPNQNPFCPENVRQNKNKPISGDPYQSSQSLLRQKFTGQKSRSRMI